MAVNLNSRPVDMSKSAAEIETPLAAAGNGNGIQPKKKVRFISIIRTMHIKWKRVTAVY